MCLCAFVQLLANVGLLATRWRLRTQSDGGHPAPAPRSSQSSGPWATLSRARRASSPTNTSPSRSSTPNGKNGAHVSHDVETTDTTDSGFRPSMHAATLAGTACTRSRAGASMPSSHAFAQGYSSPGAAERSKSARTATGNPDGSSSISTASTAAPPGSVARRPARTHGSTGTGVVAGASVADDATPGPGRPSGPFASHPAEAPEGVCSLLRLNFFRFLMRRRKHPLRFIELASMSLLLSASVSVAKRRG